EIMINVSQRVNYFFARRDPLLRRSLPFGRFHWLPNLGAPLLPPCFPFRTAFPAARKRRDFKHVCAIVQEENRTIFPKRVSGGKFRSRQFQPINRRHRPPPTMNSSGLPDDSLHTSGTD
ncbi:hypothetical protein, partial [Burkholderia glumae]